MAPFGTKRWIDPGRAPRPSRGSARRVALGAGLVVTAGLALGACASARTTSSSSGTPAKSGLEAAVASMQAAPNFSFTGAIGPERAPVRLSGQFTAPNLEHLVVTAGNGTTTELVFAGTKAYVRTANGSWVNKLSAASSPVDPRRLFQSVNGASEVTVHRDAGVALYSFFLPSSAASPLGGPTGTPSRVQGTARVVEGRLAELTLRWSGSGTQLVADVSYSNVGSSPPVVTPAVA